MEGVVTLWWELGTALSADTENCSNIIYTVRSRSFATYNDYTKRVVDYVAPTMTIEEGTRSFSPAELRSDRYYLFDVVTEYTDLSQIREESRVTSPVYYFGDQGMEDSPTWSLTHAFQSLSSLFNFVIFFFSSEEPSITIPTLESVYLRSVAEGTVILTCAATGTPLPSVQLYHRGGLSIESEEIDPSTVQKALIVNQDSVGEYYCIASATIIQPEGGPRHVTRLRSIFIEIEGERLKITMSMRIKFKTIFLFLQKAQLIMETCE